MKHLERYQQIAKLAALTITKLASQEFFAATMALTTLIDVAEQSTIYCRQLNQAGYKEPDIGELCKPHQ